MYDKLIESYVNKLTKQDIINFSYKQNIVLKSFEVDVIFTYIKKYWHVFYKGNPSLIFIELKDKLNDNTYNKIIELYNKYKNKI